MYQIMREEIFPFSKLRRLVPKFQSLAGQKIV